MFCHGIGDVSGLCDVMDACGLNFSVMRVTHVGDWCMMSGLMHCSVRCVMSSTNVRMLSV